MERSPELAKKQSKQQQGARYESPGSDKILHGIPLAIGAAVAAGLLRVLTRNFVDMTLSLPLASAAGVGTSYIVGRLLRLGIRSSRSRLDAHERRIEWKEQSEEVAVLTAELDRRIARLRLGGSLGDRALRASKIRHLGSERVRLEGLLPPTVPEIFDYDDPRCTCTECRRSPGNS